MTWTPRRALARPGSLLAETLAALPGAAGLSREFPADVLAEAEAAAAAPVLPEADATDIPFVTIDPAGATDLDQALAIERDGGGWIVHYAIADLPSFIRPDGPLDREAQRRGTTVYLPDGRLPLHPPVISEGAASLLADELRGAFVWRMSLDAAGEVITSTVARARVRNRAQLSYDEAQAALDRGTADAAFRELRSVGEARLAVEAARGGSSLNSPETLVEQEDGGFRLTRRHVRPVERWNAQLSLMTGMEAARMMLRARVGILRTMPPAEPERVAFFRRQTLSLGEPWRSDEPYGHYLARLDGDEPRHLAIMNAAAALFRGAGYTAFDGQPPDDAGQAAIGAPYAHVTAPLRRLVDRYGLELCAALAAGAEAPEWVRAALPRLPGIMAETSQSASRVDREATRSIEAAILSTHVGDEFRGVVVAAGHVQLDEPAVEARCSGADAVGTEIRVRLIEADIATGTIRFEAVEGYSSSSSSSSSSRSSSSSNSSSSSRGLT